MRRFFCSVFSRITVSQYSVQFGENTDQKKLHIWAVVTQCLVEIENDNLRTSGYKLICADHPYVKRDGVCLLMPRNN